MCVRKEGGKGEREVGWVNAIEFKQIRRVRNKQSVRVGGGVGEHYRIHRKVGRGRKVLTVYIVARC